MPEINFLRRGFANNSSSTHSIIFTNNHMDVRENDHDGMFGWNEFVLKSKRDKALYLTTMLKHSLAPEYSGITEFHRAAALQRIMDIVVPAIFLVGEDEDLADATDETIADIAYINDELAETDVDHQSMLSFPLVHGGAGFEMNQAGHKHVTLRNVDLDFFYDFVRHMLRDEYVVVGGNDNGDAPEVLDEIEGATPGWFSDLYDFLNHQYSTCIKDGDTWVIYGIENGGEIAVSFVDEERKQSGFPSLVDLKVTNKCNTGCSFCYQNSTREGEHADARATMNIVQNLADAGTGTIAIGGGNPLLYPGLVDLLRVASKEVTVCLTIEDVRTDEEKEILRKCTKYISSLAISCNETYSLFSKISRIKGALDSRYSGSVKVYGQAILEKIPNAGALKHFLDSLYTCEIYNVTLLGFKTFGRAVRDQPRRSDYNWISVCEESQVNIGIDADIAKRYRSSIMNSGVHEKYICEEGDRSMYIDAVAKTCSVDSYGGSDPVSIARVANTWSFSDDLINIFKGFRNETVQEPVQA